MKQEYEFGKIVELLRKVRDLLHPESTTRNLLHGTSLAEIITDIEHDIHDIEHHDYSALERVRAKFGNNGQFHVLALADGWQEDHSRLLRQFNSLYTEIVSRMPLGKRMENLVITIRHSIFIEKPREAVWDFTQDYDRRTQWDRTVKEAEVIGLAPRTVRLKFAGNSSMTCIYKWDDRPKKTSLAARDINSPLIASAGGSWVYEEKDGGTIWTQTNSIVLKSSYALSLLKWLLEIMFKRRTMQAMQRAKKLMEQE